MFFGSRCVCVFSGGSFSSCSGGLLMSCANMSVVRGAVVKGFATGCASKRPFGSLFVVRFQVTIEMRFLGEAFVATGAFVRFLISMGSLVSN